MHSVRGASICTYVGFVILTYYFFDHMSMHISQAAVNAVVTEREPGMVDSEEVKHGGVKIVAIRDLVDGLIRPFVGRAAGDAPLDAATGKP
jgi:hypothetical protein